MSSGVFRSAGLSLAGMCWTGIDCGARYVIGSEQVSQRLNNLKLKGQFRSVKWQHGSHSQEQSHGWPWITWEVEPTTVSQSRQGLRRASSGLPSPTPQPAEWQPDILEQPELPPTRPMSNRPTANAGNRQRNLMANLPVP
jgi:hypothetical protein